MPNNPNSLEYFLITGLLVLVVYLGILFLLYRIFKSTLSAKGSSSQRRKMSLNKVFLIVGIASFIVIAFLTKIIFFLLVPLFVFLIAWQPLFTYLNFLIPSAYALVIAAGLVLALTFASLAFRSAGLFAKTIKSAVVLTTVAWIACGLLIVFQGLWIIYLFVLVSIWPLRVVSPSGK